MGLVKNETRAVFDLEKIRRGDCIRFRKNGCQEGRNGFVVEAREDRLTVLYCNIQNSACSYMDILAEDVALKAWDVYWTRDFKTVIHEGDEE